MRWKRVPGDGEPTHYLRRDHLTDLRSKLVGGLHGSCDECERRWEATDGLASAHYDNFVLRAKAQALRSTATSSPSTTCRRAGRDSSPWTASTCGQRPCRAFRHLHRLNCVLKLMLLELRGEARVSARARILRENHRAHAGKPPPRRLHDGELLKP